MTWRPETIPEIARRVARRGDRFDPAVREFLDSWQNMPRQSRAVALAPRERAHDESDAVGSAVD